jgi:hypothetical protein
LVYSQLDAIERRVIWTLMWNLVDPRHLDHIAMV